MMQQPQILGRREWLADLAVAHSFQNHPNCKDFEIRYKQCGIAYGHYIGEEKCRSYMEDLYECVHESKRTKRVELMSKERNKQMKKGERGYLPLPRTDLL